MYQIRQVCNQFKIIKLHSFTIIYSCLSSIWYHHIGTIIQLYTFILNNYVFIYFLNNLTFSTTIIVVITLYYYCSANFFFKDSGISGGGGLGNLKKTLTAS